ncbi:MAG: hypothetical protein AAFU79_17660 [Myxococcota bacterium]
MASQYDPKDIIMTFGPVRIEGFGAGTMVSVNYNAQGAQTHVGHTGEGAVNISHDRSATVEVELMATGRGRNTLAALRAHITAGNPLLPLAIKHKSTGEQFAGFAALQQQPSAEFAGPDAAQVRSVVFVVPELQAGQTNAAGQFLGVIQG